VTNKHRHDSVLVLVALLAVLGAAGVVSAAFFRIPAHSGVKSLIAPPPPATGTPPIPTGLTFASVSTDTAILSWSASTGATSYEVDIAEDAAFTAGRAVVTSGSAPSTTYTLSGQPAGVALWARVRAVGAGGVSSSSDTASGTLVTRTLDCAREMVLTLGNGPANYVAGASGVDARWYGTSANGVVATQSTHANKPVASGSAVAFSYASTTSLVVPDIESHSLAEFTVVGKFTTTNQSLVGYPCILGKGENSDWLWGVWFATTQVTFRLDDGGETEPSATGVSLDAPHVLATTGKSGSSTIHLDGIQVATGAQIFTPDRLPIIIGNTAASTNTWTGDIYRIDIASGIMSSAELASTALWLDAPPRGPDLEPITLVSSDTLIASWTHLSGVYSYRLDVATDPAMLTGFVPGYTSRIVATSSAGGLTIDVTGYTGQTVYLRMRSAGAGGIGPSTATTAATIP